MARYSPLPPVSIDPRNESQLVQQASQRVYEASNQTLNDFSSGNPLAALLEGQAFAQGEFLFWANQLPQSILIEWIGPFLGAMRRLGTPAVAQLLITIPPNNNSVTIPIGSAFSTNPNLSGGESITFITSQEYTIPAGETSIYIAVSSQYVGNIYNCPANSITVSSAINVNGLQATNPKPAAGGSDVETFQEVQERFFTLIRRKNPVSSEDWQNFFIDFYGVGTQTSVQPNRPSQGSYNYLTDYLKPNGQVSFFVLGPNGQELTSDQIARGQNVVNFSVPVENRGHVFPITLSQVQYNITLEVDANGAFGRNLRAVSLNFRDRLFSILNPGNFFPANVDPTVSDVDAAFYSTFDAPVRFVDPHIENSVAYNTPPLLDDGAALYTQVYTFTPSEYLLNVDDLVETSLPVPAYYPVLQGFTPYSTEKKNQTIYGNLQLQQILPLVPGNYIQGQVGYWEPSNGGDGELHVILENLTIESQADVPGLITAGRVSTAKTYSSWSVGTTYFSTVVGGTAYNPDIVQYDYAANEFIPSSTVTVSKRPGTFLWVVAQNFTLGADSSSVTSAITQNLLSSVAVTPQELIPGNSYAAGTWVYTPQIGSGPDPVADPYYNYVDISKGVVDKYAYVNSAFTYNPNTPTETISVYFDTLTTQGIIKEIVVQNSSGSLPIYKYSPRFPAGTYLEYKPDTNTSAQYYIAASFFTPNSTNSADLTKELLIFPLYIDSTQKAEFLTYLQSSTSLVPTRMFRFWKGDRTFFRKGTNVLSYTATTNVTPLFDFHIYLTNGIFVPTGEFLPGTFESESYIPYFNPSYVNYSEDTIVSAADRNLYRVMKAFVPNLTVTNWTNTTVANTAREEEYEGNLLRYVNAYTCEQDILSQLGREVSAIKLGTAQITLIPKNKGRYTNDAERIVFVWENSNSNAEVPELSWFTGTTFPYNPPQYGDGTLRL